MNKITVIGTGAVGSTIAYSLTLLGLAQEIVMIDIAKEKAFGEALDIRQGTPFSSPCNIYSGEYADAAGSDIVVLTSGVARKPGQSRLDLAQINVNITKSIIPEITKYAPDATYVIVSNPVDILTYTFCKFSGLPQERIIGSGTALDTARLCTTIADKFAVNADNVNAYILGEHGDSSFVPWSLVNIAGCPIDAYASAVVGREYPELNKDEVEDYVRKSGGIVIKNKGATFYAVAISVCRICETLLRGVETPVAVSTMFNGEYGISDVCMSVPTILGKNGATNKIILPLTDEELVKLNNSADALKDVINNIQW